MNAAIPNSSYKHQAPYAAGFTLIELMVTIAVLAIIVSIAAPNVSTQLANQRVKATAATLENALKEAKTESIIRRQTVTLSYDNTSDPKVITIKDLSNVIIASYPYNDNSKLKPVTATSIEFQPSKRVSTARTYTVCDNNTAATYRQIVVTKVANITNQTGGTCP